MITRNECHLWWQSYITNFISCPPIIDLMMLCRSPQYDYLKSCVNNEASYSLTMLSTFLKNCEPPCWYQKVVSLSIIVIIRAARLPGDFGASLRPSGCGLSEMNNCILMTMVLEFFGFSPIWETNNGTFNSLLSLMVRVWFSHLTLFSIGSRMKLRPMARWLRVFTNFWNNRMYMVPMIWWLSEERVDDLMYTLRMPTVR